MIFNKHLFCFCFLVFCASVWSFEIRVRTRPYVYAGERAFVSVEILEGDPVTINTPRGDGHGHGPYTIENISSGNGFFADWLYPHYRQEYNPDPGGNAYDHWVNNQRYYLELSGVIPSSNIGTYSGKVRVCLENTTDCKEGNYSFVTQIPAIGLAPLFQDYAASYDRQMELYTRIRNNAATTLSFDRPYMDYYFKKDPKRQAVISPWVTPGNTCIEVLTCGNNNFILRHHFTSTMSLAPGATSGQFKIGYNEVENWAAPSDPYNYSPIPEKSGVDTWLDYSYSHDFTYVNQMNNDVYWYRAWQRNEYFNPYLNIFDQNGNLLSGDSIPVWANSGCTKMDVTMSTTYNPDIVRTNDAGTLGKFCTASNFNTPPVISFGANTYDFIFEGEDYVSFPEVTDADGDAVTLSLIEHSNFFEVGTTADYLPESDWPHRNAAGNEYVRSVNSIVRQRGVRDPGTYYYTLRATDSKGAFTEVRREVRILHGEENVNAAGKKLAVLMGDETWFRPFQLDIATGIVNFSDETVILNNFYYDYYGHHGESVHINLKQPNYWYTNTGFTPEYTDCGSNFFRLRYRYEGSVTIPGGYSFFDNKAGFVYGGNMTLDKFDDWSSFQHVNYRRQYNKRMPLYDGDGTLLWGGDIPPWVNRCDAGGGSSSSSVPVSSSSMVSSSSAISSSSNTGSGICPKHPLPGIPANPLTACFEVNNKCYQCNSDRGEGCGSDWLWIYSFAPDNIGYWYTEIPCSSISSSS
ncbi:MAG: hypothetical protein LBR60_06675, partial [Fibrobacter sp.]|nr:hypothetical protein [Fibrobacter sp.]